MRHSAVSVAALVVLFYFGQAALHAAAAITLLHEFAGGANDGADPTAGLTLSGSTLFGTTRYGGDPCPNISVGCGTVFSMNTDGSGFTLEHEFVGGPNDGQSPGAGLTLSGSTLFGTTTAGGDYNAGTIFAISTVGSGFTLLHEFVGNDGDHPVAGLTLSGSTLYGTTVLGGNGGEGAVFSINTNGSGFTLLHSFAPANDGRRPIGGLSMSGSALFGTTSLGGGNTRGTIYSINTDGTGYQTLHEFAGGANDGGFPLAGLTVSGSTLYGTTQEGGDNNVGTIFSINTDGSGFTLLHEFAGGADDGDAPEAELTLNGSTLYGTTTRGGNNNLGTIFSIHTDGSGFTLVHEYAGGADDGALGMLGIPDAGLTLSGSTLYGVTDRGGDFIFGTVFSIEIAEPGLPGDYNHNGFVDAADYVLWRKNDGTPGGYNTWRAHFGETAGSGSGATGSTSATPAVPEPTSLVLLILAALTLTPTPTLSRRARENVQRRSSHPY